MAQTDRQTFYSYAPNLSISANKGKERLQEGGTYRRVGEKLIQFTDTGDGYEDEKGIHKPLGRFVTDDPELIKFLEDRIAVTGDVIDQKEYNRLIVPPAEREAKMQRQIEEQNRLIADLQKSGKR